MADRYWVGGTGTWSDAANHWSDSSGGSPNATFLPTTSDNVFFDVNSFSGASQTVTAGASSNCYNMTWTGATNNPTLSITGQVYVYGSLTLISGMSVTGLNLFYFKATTTGHTVTTAGVNIPSTVYFDGVGGGWTLQDNFTASSGFNVRNGALNTNNKNITTSDFTISFATTRSLTLGSSTITCSGQWVATNTTNLTFNAGTSTIVMSGNTKTFAGGGLTYNKLQLTGTPITIEGSNTFAELQLTAAKTVKFTAGTTQTVTTWSGDGSLGNVITLQSTSAGTFYTINKTSGTVTKQYYSVQDCHVGGGATFKAYLSTDVSGNDGWAIISSGAMPVSTLKNVRFPLRKLGIQFKYVR